MQTKVEDNYRIESTCHNSFQRLKGSVKRLKQICNLCPLRNTMNGVPLPDPEASQSMYHLDISNLHTLSKSQPVCGNSKIQ